MFVFACECVSIYYARIFVYSFAALVHVFLFVFVFVPATTCSMWRLQGILVQLAAAAQRWLVINIIVNLVNSFIFTTTTAATKTTLVVMATTKLLRLSAHRYLRHNTFGALDRHTHTHPPICISTPTYVTLSLTFYMVSVAKNMAAKVFGTQRQLQHTHTHTARYLCIIHLKIFAL